MFRNSLGKKPSPLKKSSAVLPSSTIARVMPAMEGSASSKLSMSGTLTVNSRSLRFVHSIRPSTAMASPIAASTHMGISIMRCSSDLLVDQVRAPIDEPVPGGTLPPLLQGHLPGNLQVALERLPELAGHSGIDQPDARLVVDVERPVVEVGRAHVRPEAVHDHYLLMVEAGQELVDLDPLGEQILVAAVAGVAHDGAVGDRAGEHDPDLDPALRRLLQQAHQLAVGDEVGVLDQDLLLGGADGELEEQLQAGDAPLRG